MISGLVGSIVMIRAPGGKIRALLELAARFWRRRSFCTDHGRANRSTMRREPRRKPCRYSLDQQRFARYVRIFPNPRGTMFRRHRSICRFRRQWTRCCASTIHRRQPNVFRIVRVERDGADRLHRLFVKYRAIPRSAVVGFPNAATGSTHKERDLARWLAHPRDAGDTSAHRRRSDVARAEPGNARRIKWSVSCVDRNGAKKKRRENASHSNSESFRESITACEIHRGVNSVLRKHRECANVLWRRFW